MAGIQFRDPSRGEDNTLSVQVKPNSIEWSYQLNTANYPTYGGEVIQILSVFIEDMTITGSIGSYREMEEIFAWFVEYMEGATQGNTGQGADGYKSTPVHMYYEERGWTFHLIPKSLPSFKYGRDIVVPEWTMQAAVVEPDWGIGQQAYKELGEAILPESGKTYMTTQKVSLFGKATLNTSSVADGKDTAFDFKVDDPFSGPTTKQYEEGKVRGHYKDLSETYKQLIPAYLAADFRSLNADYSKPAFLSGGGKGTDPPSAPAPTPNPPSGGGQDE